MKYIFAALIILLTISCDKQYIAPTEEELPSTNTELKALLTEDAHPKLKISVYHKLYKLNRSENLPLALEYLRKEKKIANEIGDYLISGNASYNLGLYEKRSGNYIESINHYLDAITAYESNTDTTSIGEVLNNLGNLFLETGNYSYSERLFIKARDFLPISDHEWQLIINYNLGTCHFQKVNPDLSLAEDFFNKSLVLAEKLNDDYEKNSIYNQLGSLYQLDGKYDLAIENFQNSLKYLDFKVDNSEKYAIAYTNIGETHIYKDDLIEAEKSLMEVLPYLQTIKDKKLIIGIYNVLGRLHLKKGDFEESIKILEKAKEKADKSKINKPFQETLNLLSTAYKSFRQTGRTISIEKYEEIIELDKIQDKLREEFNQKASYKSLQAALGLTIELDKETKAKHEEMEDRILASNIAMALAVVLIIASLAIFTYRKKYNKSQETVNGWQEVCLHATSVMASVPVVREHIKKTSESAEK